MVHRLDAAEVQYLVEDLRGRQVAAELHRAGRAERAGERAARLRGDADRAAAVAVAHQHGLDGASVAGPEQRLDRAVLACASLATSSVENGTRSPERRARRPEVGHRVVAGRAGRRPAPHLAGAEGGLAEIVQRRPVGAEVHAPMVASPCAMAKFLAHAGVASRRAAEQLVFAGRVSVDGGSCAIRRATWRGDAVAVDGRGVALERRHVVYALNKPAGYVSTAKDPQGRPTVVSLVAAASGSTGRAARCRHHRAPAAHQRRRAGPPAHASLVRSPAHLPRAGAQPARARAGATPAGEGVVLDDGITAPAGPRRLAPDRVEIVLHEGRKRQVRRMSTRSGTRCCGWSGSRSGRCGSATCRSAATGCSSPPRWRRSERGDRLSPARRACSFLRRFAFGDVRVRKPSAARRRAAPRTSRS